MEKWKRDRNMKKDIRVMGESEREREICRKILEKWKKEGKICRKISEKWGEREKKISENWGRM